MHDQDMAIVKALVPVAWADGNFEEHERQMIDALLDAYSASDAEKKELQDYAATKRSLEDINLQDLSWDDRRVLLQHAVLLTFADGEQTTDEIDFLVQLAQRLRIPDDEAKGLMDAGADRAKKFLHIL